MAKQSIINVMGAARVLFYVKSNYEQFFFMVHIINFVRGSESGGFFYGVEMGLHFLDENIKIFGGVNRNIHNLILSYDKVALR